MPEVRFPIGRVFGGDDSLSRWIHGLSLISNDTVVSNTHLVEALAKGDEEPSPEGVYFLRLAASHYREAAKFQGMWDADAEVADFISQLPPGVQSDYQAFLASYNPWEGSFVATTIKRVRDQLFHYPLAGDAEVDAAVHELANHEGVYRSEANFASLRALFADDVASQMAFGWMSNQEDIGKALQRLAELMNGLIRFAEASITLFLHARGEIGGNVADLD